MRRDTVKRLTTIKQKENKDDNSLEKKKLNKKEFNNNYSIKYKIVYLDKKKTIEFDPLLNKALNLLGVSYQLINFNNFEEDKPSNDADVKSNMHKIMAAGYNRIVIAELYISFERDNIDLIIHEETNYGAELLRLQ